MPAAHGDCSPGVALDVVGDMSVRPGACPSGWGPSTPSGTEILSPDAWGVPLRSGVHPAAWNVPGRTVQGWVRWWRRHSWEGCCLSGLVVVSVCVGRRWWDQAMDAPLKGGGSLPGTGCAQGLHRGAVVRVMTGESDSAHAPTSGRWLSPLARVGCAPAGWPARPRRAGPRLGSGRRRAVRVSLSD